MNETTCYIEDVKRKLIYI